MASANQPIHICKKYLLAHTSRTELYLPINPAAKNMHKQIVFVSCMSSFRSQLESILSTYSERFTILPGTFLLHMQRSSTAITYLKKDGTAGCCVRNYSKYLWICNTLATLRRNFDNGRRQWIQFAFVENRGISQLNGVTALNTHSPQVHHSFCHPFSESNLDKRLLLWSKEPENPQLSNLRSHTYFKFSLLF